MKKKIEYSTAYDQTNTVCGYVMAIDCGDYYKINSKQWARCLDNRTIGGIAGIVFHEEKPVYVMDY